MKRTILSLIVVPVALASLVGCSSGPSGVPVRITDLGIEGYQIEFPLCAGDSIEQISLKADVRDSEVPAYLTYGPGDATAADTTYSFVLPADFLAQAKLDVDLPQAATWDPETLATPGDLLPELTIKTSRATTDFSTYALSMAAGLEDTDFATDVMYARGSAWDSGSSGSEVSATTAPDEIDAAFAEFCG